jgi:hypothetical protein
MPTKKQKLSTNRKFRKKTARNKIILISIAILAFVMLVTGYYFFKRPSGILTDGSSEKTERPSHNRDNPAIPAEIENFQGAIAKAKLKLEAVDNKDILKVIIEKAGEAKNGEISYKYEWTINGQPAGSGGDSVSGFKRGDKVAVKITPFEGEKTGSSRVLTVDVQNTPPKVSESREPKYEGKTFTAQINGADTDGDTLSYELLKGPEGMKIDKKSGMVSWPLKDNDAGDYPVSVKITDGHGGETTYQLTATIPKESLSPATIPKKTP